MSEIKSALTAEEWADGKTERGYSWTMVGGDLWLSPPGDGPLVLIQNRHAAAALCLHEQPLGFTREDITLISLLRSNLPIGRQAAVRDSHALADRIEALLPPDGE